MKKKILYLMHVPWGWVKQRPHFIAEYLANSFDVTVCHTEVFLKRLLVDNPLPIGLKLTVLPMLRLAHIEPITSINRCRLSRLVKELFEKEQYDMVWVSHPEIYAIIKGWLPAFVPMLCDCMDDCLEFSLVKNDSRKLNWLCRIEREMLNRADLVFASSVNLRQILLERHRFKKQVTVINNGIQLESERTVLPMQDELTALKQRGFFLVSYIGTVSDWLDKELLLMALDRFPRVVFTIFGPVDSKLPKHERIISFGPIGHKHVFSAMEASDALVMPFCVTPLIESVNPVKLYEYIYSGKPTLAVAYGETKKFGEYVHLYRNRAEFLSLLEMLVDGNLRGKLPLDYCRSFALSNTWEIRAQEIIRSMSMVLPTGSLL